MPFSLRLPAWHVFSRWRLVSDSRRASTMTARLCAIWKPLADARGSDQSRDRKGGVSNMRSSSHGHSTTSVEAQQKRARRRTMQKTNVFEAFQKSTLGRFVAGARWIACLWPGERSCQFTIAAGSSGEFRSACAGAGRKRLLQGKLTDFAAHYAPPARQGNAIPCRHGYGPLRDEHRGCHGRDRGPAATTHAISAGPGSTLYVGSIFFLAGKPDRAGAGQDSSRFLPGRQI